MENAGRRRKPPTICKLHSSWASELSAVNVRLASFAFQCEFTPQLSRELPGCHPWTGAFLFWGFQLLGLSGYWILWFSSMQKVIVRQPNRQLCKSVSIYPSIYLSIYIYLYLSSLSFSVIHTQTHPDWHRDIEQYHTKVTAIFWVKARKPAQ
jgi:hypothetical protein